MSIPLDSASELLRLQQTGQVSAVEIATAALDRTSQTEGAIGAFIHRADPLRVLADAAEIDRRRGAGEAVGPLAGIPIAVKDLLCTTDMPTTCASRMLDGYTSPYAATVVNKLKDAGALIIGKANLDEFAMGGSTETSAFGVTRNPWDISRTPGGSSGGTAAAIAAMNCPLGIGTDTGGSIRQPAAFCSLTGIKPTYGRISRFGLVAFASSLDQIGPMAWDMEDCARLLEVISGFDPKDSTSLDVAVPQFGGFAEKGGGGSADLKGVRVGVLRDAIEAEGLEPEIRKVILEGIEVFRELGAEIIDITLPHWKHWVPAYYVIAPCEASSNLSRYDGAHYGFRARINRDQIATDGPLMATYCQSRDQGFGDEVKRRILVGTYALSTGYYDAYYLKALQVRRLIRGDFDAAFQKVDILVGPTTPTSAFRLGEKLEDPLQMYLGDLFTVGANLAGIPAASVPAGFCQDGLPVGMHLQAPPLEEARLVRAGLAFQRVTTHHLQRPRS